MSALFPLLATLLTSLAVIGLFRARTLLRRILALNVLASALFLLLVTLARTETGLDPVPHAMVLTGIVVAVSTTAAALALVIRAAGHRHDGRSG